MPLSQCRRCGKECSFLDRFMGGGQEDYCRPCRKETHRQLQDILALFQAMTTDGYLTPGVWHDLVTISKQRQLEMELVHGRLRSSAIELFDRTIVALEQTGKISAKDEAYLQFLQSALALRSEDLAPSLARLQRLRKLIAIRQGDFEPIVVNELLDRDEQVYCRVAVSYLATEQRSRQPPQPVYGILLLANRHLYFKPETARGLMIKWRNVLQPVLVSVNGIHLRMVQSAGEGIYTLLDADAEIVQAYMLALIQQAKHHLTPIPASGKSQALFVAEAPRSQYDSLAEKAFLACWKYPDLPLVHQYPIRTAEKTYRVDFAHLATRTAIEIDGFVGHSRAEDIQKDRYRQRTIEALGWHFRRYSGLDLKQDPLAVVQDVRAYLIKQLHLKAEG
ncbi:endonuclease domain-containing protein [Tengunoibacter tsumagoiensis]|uniref:DUF559 domain-containing protein n=1 Tax=Tengunoibacter tsumagoiensis TaxID=2014871 RepID=A0A402AAK0_9CHLR|nr:DUF559 domain-containing protein [Tengunoibacter tsumagoiensis]GCE16194.1 hypothetical protein KTT_60530 [Tengunoibacter tsumagoiensis]